MAKKPVVADLEETAARDPGVGLADAVPATPVEIHLRLRVRAMAREIIDQAKAGAHLGTIQRLAREIETAVETP